MSVKVDTPPRTGELIYGCRHDRACGTVVTVDNRPLNDGCGGCYVVTEDWLRRHVRVRRESNGNLYEVHVWEN